MCIRDSLKDEDRSKLGTLGIAFTLNLSGMSAILAVALSRLEEMKPERGEQFMEQGRKVVLKMELSASMPKVKEILKQVYENMLVDDRFKTLLLYYD